MIKKINGGLLWGAGDSIHKLEFNATVNTETKVVETLKFEMENNFLDDILQDVFQAGSQEALRLAND
jgi:hypothetical protein